MSEFNFWVNCETPGLRFLQYQLKSSEVTGIPMANGIADILPLQPFRVRVLNTSNEDRVLPKGSVIGHAVPHLKGIVNLASDEPPPVAYRLDVDGDTWKHDVDLSHFPSEKRDAIYQLLGKHLYMWDGRLGLSSRYRTSDRPQSGIAAGTYTTVSCRTSCEINGTSRSLPDAKCRCHRPCQH
jgi:hypothetical protein